MSHHELKSTKMDKGAKLKKNYVRKKTFFDANKFLGLLISELLGRLQPEMLAILPRSLIHKPSAMS